jgi:hypothetical protein
MSLVLVLAAVLALPRPAEVSANAFFAAFNARDFLQMEALYASDAILTSPDFCTPRGKRDLRRTYQTLFQAHPDVQDIVDVMVVEADRVAIKFDAVSKAGARPLRLSLMTFCASAAVSSSRTIRYSTQAVGRASPDRKLDAR